MPLLVLRSLREAPAAPPPVLAPPNSPAGGGGTGKRSSSGTYSPSIHRHWEQDWLEEQERMRQRGAQAGPDTIKLGDGRVLRLAPNRPVIGQEDLMSLAAADVLDLVDALALAELT